ncbi:Clp protease N-terminal domain-containing protein [Actinomadura sp. DC4]|uniref:Clp protease N-terminal domain-containing protein n=1 Tax=Actinomadura sp. DC4 TaxID=3055069 RepID=UPI0025AFF474|nr:Clp protease N-terminal domain-containing protein [Actinomadura sp. DC4]MDN3351204.1 Clp protease N-terminal domain-containing protein [Actinomadura sp. DC4]
MYERFTGRARQAVVAAQEEARLLGAGRTGTEHLLLGLLHERGGVAAKALEYFGVGVEAARAQVHEIAEPERQPFAGHIPFSPQAKKALDLSLREARELAHDDIEPEHILLGLIGEGEGAGVRILAKLGADPGRVRAQMIQLLGGHPVVEAVRPDALVLGQFGRDLTRAASEGRLDPVIGREEEIKRVMRVLMLRTRNSAMLIGEHGVGKTAVARGVAHKIAGSQVPSPLRGVRIHALELGTLRNGSRPVDLRRQQEVIQAEIGRHEDIVVFVEDVQTLTGASATEDAMDAASILKPMLLRGEVRVIATVTPAEHRHYLRGDAALERRFQAIQVAEPTIADTLEILKALRCRYQAHHQVEFTDAALEAVARLAGRHLPDRPMPGKAIDLLDLTGAQVHMRATTDPGLRDLDQRIAAARREKEFYIDSQDFVRAAALLDTMKKLTRERKDMETAGLAAAARVDESDVADALAIISGGSGEQPGRRRDASAPATHHDAEIWAMS